MDKDNPKKDGDEEGENKKDFQDPAIISAVTYPRCNDLPPETNLDYRYTRDELLKLRKAPNSQKRPKYLDSAYFNQSGVWDPEPWHYSNKQAENQSENGSANTDDFPSSGGGNKRSRPSDPRERIRKEQDGIVLSPQRRSFNSGCFVPNSRDNAANVATAALPLRPGRAHSPLGATAGVVVGGGVGVKNDQHMQRRIGSGRILPWDYQEKTEENDFGYRPRGVVERGERGDRRNDDRDERFERRSYGRDFESNSSKEKHGRQPPGRGYNRRINEQREEEPEWFSSGPISQNDTIELRGFDDPMPEKANNKKNAKQQLQQQTKKNVNGDAQIAKKVETAKKNSVNKDSLIGKELQSSGRTSPNNNTANAATEKAKGSEDDKEKKGLKIGGPENVDTYNFDALFKADTLTIPGLLSNGIEAGDAAGSRFSRWFQREKSPPTTKPDSRRSSLDQDHHHFIKNLLGDTFNEPKTVTIPQPGDSESYFAPISPAQPPQNQHQVEQQQQQKSLFLMEMLQRGPGHVNKKADATPAPGSGKILSLEELEGSLRQGAPEKAVPNKSSEEDMNAFKQLFSGMNVNGPMQQKPMSLMDMLSHSQQKDAEANRIHHARNMNAPQIHPHMSDVAFKLQQVQKHQQLEMLAKLINSGNFNAGAHQQQRASPLAEMTMTAMQNRELLNRPEAQAIMQGLKRGDITPQHLYQQLANPAMQPRHRDLLLTILKIQQQAPAPSTAQPPPPPAVVQQHPPVQQQQQQTPVSPNFYNAQQQLRVSPLPPNAYCVSPIMATSPNTLSVPALHQRIPSPRELQVHTQNIMQRALIKKKLEEQEENYRKKQQAQQQQRGAGTGSPAKTASPTPLTFMPTSVMRKLTAEKDDASKDGKDKVPQGRPLTGLRSSVQGPAAGQQALSSHAQQAQNWNSHFNQQMKQPGRAIVKANNYQGNQSSNQQEYFQQQQHRLLHQAQAQHLPQQQQQQQQPPPPPPQQSAHNKSFYGQSSSSAPYQQLSQQQLRQQHQNVRAQHQQQQPPASFQHPPAGNWMAQSQGFDNHQMNRGDLSPTSDQLARWFSPDLLERARKGNVPSIPASAMAQHALSLEEIERQTTPVGHN